MQQGRDTTGHKPGHKSYQKKSDKYNTTEALIQADLVIQQTLKLRKIKIRKEVLRYKKSIKRTSDSGFYDYKSLISNGKSDYLN